MRKPSASTWSSSQVGLPMGCIPIWWVSRRAGPARASVGGRLPRSHVAALVAAFGLPDGDQRDPVGERLGLVALLDPDQAEVAREQRAEQLGERRVPRSDPAPELALRLAQLGVPASPPVAGP